MASLVLRIGILVFAIQGCGDGPLGLGEGDGDGDGNINDDGDSLALTSYIFDTLDEAPECGEETKANIAFIRELPEGIEGSSLGGGFFFCDGTEWQPAGRDLFRGKDGEDGSKGATGAIGASGLTPSKWLGVLGEAPANPFEGDGYYDSSRSKAFVYVDGEWVEMFSLPKVPADTDSLEIPGDKDLGCKTYSSSEGEGEYDTDMTLWVKSTAVSSTPTRIFFYGTTEGAPEFKLEDISEVRTWDLISASSEGFFHYYKSAGGGLGVGGGSSTYYARIAAIAMDWHGNEVLYNIFDMSNCTSPPSIRKQ